ncbi:MAG: response regulator [Planctomycetes bacterium]|nr:response regulator [Planctomycetota bacterium]
MIHRPVRILVVESDPDAFESLEPILDELSEFEYEFSWIRYDVEAVERLRRSQFDICVVSGSAESPRAVDIARHAHRNGTPIPVISLCREDEPVSADRFDSGDEPTGSDEWDAVRLLDRRDLDARGLEKAVRGALSYAAQLEARREAQQRYRRGVPVDEDGVWDWDLESGIVYYSDRWKQQLGYTSREIGDSIDEWRSRIHPDDRGDHISRIEAHRSGNASLFRHEHRMRHRDGSYRWMLSRGTVVVSEDGRSLRMRGTQRDITERKKADKPSPQQDEDHAERVRKLEAIGRLAGGIAHDFNNLLLVMSGYTNLLSEKTGEDWEYREELLEIQKAAQQALLLTKPLLAFSRKDSDELETLDLGLVLNEMSSILQSIVGQRIELEIEKAECSLPLRATPGQLAQILMNLATNARDAMSGSGLLTIDARSVSGRAGREIRLRVTDDGVGMDEETQKQLFEPFFTTRKSGHGLGLSTVSHIVERCGGRIQVRSQPGEGTCFEIYFPQAETHERVDESARSLKERQIRARKAIEFPASGASARASSVGGHAPHSIESFEPTGAPPAPKRILLVEDNENVRVLVHRILDAYDFEVIVARDAQEALDLAQSFDRFDLLLTDVIMPKIDGNQLAERLRESRPTLRVLFMSGYPGDRLGTRDFEVGRTEFIPKPFEPEVLLAKIHDLLDMD